MKPASLIAVVLHFTATASADTLQSAGTLPCDSVNDAALREAVMPAKSYVAKSWISQSPDLIAAYDSPEVRQNPFAAKIDGSGLALCTRTAFKLSSPLLSEKRANYKSGSALSADGGRSAVTAQGRDACT